MPRTNLGERSYQLQGSFPLILTYCPFLDLDKGSKYLKLITFFTFNELHTDLLSAFNIFSISRSNFTVTCVFYTRNNHNINILFDFSKITKVYLKDKFGG